MTRILLDTNVVLDIALERPPYLSDAKAVVGTLADRRLSAYVSASAITDIFYITRKSKGREAAKQFIQDLISIVQVVGVDHAVIQRALSTEMKDFEDAVQGEAASQAGIDYLITRNEIDFAKSPVPAMSPSAFLQWWADQTERNR